MRPLRAPFVHGLLVVTLAALGVSFAPQHASAGTAARKVPVTEAVLYRFGQGSGPNRSGYAPETVPVEGADQMLYGTTSQGGALGFGTIWRLGRDSQYEDIHAFTSYQDRLTAALSADAQGRVYGTTQSDGAYGLGTIVRVLPTGDLRDLADLDARTGNYVEAPLLAASDGRLYGATIGSGGLGFGTLFRTTTDLHRLEVLHDFDEDSETVGLMQASDGSIYGTMAGANGRAAIFRLSSDGRFEVIHRLTTDEGTDPAGALTEGPDGALYGTFRSGGPHAGGTIVRIPPTGPLTVLVAFGEYQAVTSPVGSLVVAGDGQMYGTLAGGRQAYFGAIYRLDSAGRVVIVYRFGAHDDDGSGPTGLMRGSDGNLYGTTYSTGYGYESGTLYRMGPPPRLAH
jgi:uncharacterized repeat protein (TIGR03803 family)